MVSWSSAKWMRILVPVRGLALFARALRQFRQRLQERFAAGFGFGHEELHPFGEVAQVGFGDVVVRVVAGADVSVIEVLETFFGLFGFAREEVRQVGRVALALPVLWACCRFRVLWGRTEG